jgi:hypothetical protein
MPAVKSARIKADRVKELVRIKGNHPHLTDKMLAKMFSVTASTIAKWKVKAGIE